MKYIPFPAPTIGTAVTLLAAWAIRAFGQRYITRHVQDSRERYSRRKLLGTSLTAATVAVLVVLWSSRFPNPGIFLGLLGAGIAVVLKDPLLSIVGRMAIFAGGMYTVGDRVEIGQMKGDVIDVGLLYTRLMEIGNWIEADMATGRTVQFSNAKVFAEAIFNYTSHFEYIWDEIHLPITYASNLKAANEILLRVGSEYTREFLAGAEKALDQMGREFLVPRFQLDPNVYVRVTSNWVECSLRYIVDAKKRRAATNFIFRSVFEQIQLHQDIQIASQTMDVSVHEQPKTKA
ncbi:MAG TPA: mechanosensitive ion channel family protein [Patescibacteria group bacterium]|nr:mechanosensitive ion channel family protein [Patescibacteria group bacterium]